ncbi:MAG: hypothetical protein ABSA13_11270 [Beijerinckiaceae bacterium]
MSHMSRSILIATVASAAILSSALSASAAIHRSGGRHPNFGGFHGRTHAALSIRGPRGPIGGFPVRGGGPRHPPIWVWHHRHHFPIYGGPVIPVAVGTEAVVATTDATAPVAGCAVPAGSIITVTFLPTVTAADITTFLQSYHVTLSDGPDADGIYKIRLSDQPLPETRINEVITSMRSQTTIIRSVQG